MFISGEIYSAQCDNSNRNYPPDQIYYYGKALDILLENFRWGSSIVRKVYLQTDKITVSEKKLLFAMKTWAINRQN